MNKTLLALLTLVVAGCGFHLRGQATLPFDTLYVGTSSALGTELKRNIVAGTNAKLVDNTKDAQAVLTVLVETPEKVILSLSTTGRVNEYQLRYRFGFRVTDNKGREFVPANEIVLTRDITFNDADVLAKETEEGLLYRDMQSDMVQQVLRRLAAAKPPVAVPE